MKLTTFVSATIGLLVSSPLVLAAPTASTPKPITDPTRLAALKLRHDRVIEAFRFRSRNGTSSTASRLSDGGIIGDDDGSVARVPMMVGPVYIGFYLIMIAEDLLSNFDDIASSLFPGWESDPIWDSEDYCRTRYTTKGGGNCNIEVWVKDDGDLSQAHEWPTCAWVDTDPPIQYYNDEGLGEYSVQFTATDEYAYDGINDLAGKAVFCNQEGLCNPQYIFYREGFELVLNPWETEGSISECQHSGTDNCGGLCQLGVSDQWGSGGLELFGQCAIPCADEGQMPPSKL